MGKNIDLLKILAIVILGMFIPFTGSIAISYKLDLLNINDIFRIILTFAYFIIIFGLELLIVYVYYKLTSKIGENKLKKYRKH